MVVLLRVVSCSNLLWNGKIHCLFRFRVSCERTAPPFFFCTNVLIMSSSEETVLQKKDAEAMVTWREYEALRDHLKRTIEHSADTLDGDIEAVKTQLGTTETTINTIQTQVTDIQTNMTRLEATMTRLTGMLENQQFEDAASMGDNEEADPALNLGRGRGNANYGVDSIRWVGREFAKRRPRMMLLGDPSSQFRSSLAKMQKSSSIGRCALSLYGVCMSALMTGKFVWQFRNLMNMLCHGGIMLAVYAVTITWYPSSLGVI